MKEEEKVANTVNKFPKNHKDHPSILQIKSFLKYPNVFSFKYSNVEDIKREINNLNSKKVTSEHDIPVQILQWNFDVIAPVLTECYYQNIKN